MTNTDLGSLEFMVIAEDSCDCGEREMRDILFRIFLDNSMQHRLHLSGEFFAQFNKRNESVCKQISLLRIRERRLWNHLRHLRQPQGVLRTLRIYYETNKKHKGMRTGTKGMDVGNYASCILIIKEAKEGSRRFAKKQKQTRFQSNKGIMVMVTIEKCELGQLTDKRYILSDGISSFPYGHKDLKIIENFKDEIFLIPEKVVEYHKDNLLRFEQGKLQSNERMGIINSALL